MNKGSISYEFAKDHVEKWVKGWNDHDLNAIMTPYAEKLEFSSPKIKMNLGENRNNTIRSKGVHVLQTKKYSFNQQVR